jgi:alpha-glucosidase (family GH31 glycosyl hydrolase)
MIGGNAYTYNGSTIDFDSETIELPDYELYIRWAQVSAFLPSMQFSISPWQYNQTCEEICKKLLIIHTNLVYPKLVKYADLAVETGEPIIRPVWWADNCKLLLLF